MKKVRKSGVMISKNYNFLLGFIVACFCCFATSAQEKGLNTLKGKITNTHGEPVGFIQVHIAATEYGATTDEKGDFSIVTPLSGKYRLEITAPNYHRYQKEINIKKGVQTIPVIQLHIRQNHLHEVNVIGKTEGQELKESGYSINVIETKQYQNIEVNINQLATRSAGIRVRESGGLGSDFNYSLNGMSGRSVRFFIDGIPMDRYGSGYAVNNFPVNLIERVEIYKGVVPPQFGSDALGGIINLVSKNKKQSYLDVSYSLGSFNTHRAALSSRWINDSTHFYIDAQGFYNYSDNNYEVWGKGVEIADPKTGRPIALRTQRFHDAYRSASGKLGLGFFDINWADEINANIVYANNFREIQHGTTMAAVYGEAVRKEQSMAPSLYYLKKNIFKSGLDIQLYSSVSFQESQTIDTSSRTYDWSGKVVDEQPSNSEMGRGNNGKSALKLQAVNWFQQVNFSYKIHDNHTLHLNYTFDHTSRKGEDSFVASRTASFVAPQVLQKQVSALSYELKTFKEKLTHTLWLKNYHFHAATVDEKYITDSLGYRPVTSPIQRNSNHIGYGYATQYSLNRKQIFKLSIEKSYRLPDAEEVLGDGLFTRASPFLEPEESININLGWMLNNYPIGNNGSISIEPTLFFRNTSNKILYQLQGNLGAGAYQNILKTRGWGASLDLSYKYKNIFHLNGNITYQKMRDWNAYIGNNKNLTYKDLLPNTPYLMANGECSFTQKNLLKENTQFSAFWNVQYVHEFYLRWPSLGNQNKAVIPTQLVHHTGISYALHGGRYNVSAGCQNIFDKQVYDNYLLQKPGRSYYIKLRFFIN